MHSNLKRFIATVGITGIAYVLNYMITLFLTPYITNTVGTEAYGFVSLSKNFAQYATYATLALNSFASRFISVSYHKKDMDQANVYFSSTFYGDVILGATVFAVSLAVIFNLEHILQIPAGIQTDVKLLFLFVFLRFLVTTTFSVYESGAVVSNRLYLTGAFRLVAYIVEAGVLLAMYCCLRPNVYYVGAAILLASLVEIVANYGICKKYTPELYVSKSRFQMQAVKDLVGNGIWASVNSLGSFLHSGLDLMMCNLMLSPLIMGQLAISESIGMIFKSVQNLVNRPLQPAMLKSYAEGDIDKLLKQLKLSMKACSALPNICFAGFFTLGLTYYRLWIPNQDIAFIWKLTVISTSTCLLSGAVSPLYFVYTLKLRNRIPCFFALGTGALNVISMYFLIRYTNLGAYAVVWTTVVLVGVLNLVIHPLYISHVMEVSKLYFYPDLLRCVASGILLVALFKGFSLIYLPDSWITLAATALIYALIGGIVHFIVTLSKEERNIFIMRIKKGVIRE